MGVLAVHLFSNNGVFMTWSSDAFSGLLWNFVGLVAIVAWTFVTCYVMFSVLKAVGLLRVDPEMEFKGK